MTRFDFKKWVVEHKHGKQSLNEQNMGDKFSTTRTRKGGRLPIPETACQAYTSDPSQCYRFSLCVNGQNDGSDKVVVMGGAFGIVTAFYNEMCPGGCQQNDVVEDSLGSKWIYEGTNIIGATTISSPAITLVGPSTCTPPPTGFECTTLGQPCTPCTPVDPANGCYATAQDCQNTCQTVVDGCMDMAATNFNPSATNDDGTCFYGYNCRKQTSPQDVGVNEWVGIDMCFEAPLGTTGTFPDLASCSNVCGPRGRDTGKTRDQPYVPIATNPDVPTIDY
jgi:hypothetical protein|tara:strand:- start:164 stop:997 length:834 start_codon:yes stop_codon:yes gene_type:complete